MVSIKLIQIKKMELHIILCVHNRKIFDYSHIADGNLCDFNAIKA